MLTTGITLGLLTGAGFFIIFKKLPQRLQRWFLRHQLFTDAIACILTYMLFGGSVTGLFAAAFVGLVTSMMLSLMNNPKSAALLDRMASKAKQFKEALFNSIPEQPQLRAV